MGAANLRNTQTWKRWAGSGLADWLRADGGVLLLPQLAPYLLSSALSWATAWGCFVATWTPPPRAPPPIPAPLRPGCSASAAGDKTWGCGSNWVGAPVSRGGREGWKVGDVSCDCFLFRTLTLRGMGSGCLLTVLWRGGEGRKIQEGQTIHHQTEWRRRKRRQTEKQREQWETERERETVLPELSETSSERKTQRGHKTTWQSPQKWKLDWTEMSLQTKKKQTDARPYKQNATQEAHTKHKTSNLQYGLNFNWNLRR